MNDDPTIKIELDELASVVIEFRFEGDWGGGEQNFVNGVARLILDELS